MEAGSSEQPHSDTTQEVSETAPTEIDQHAETELADIEIQSQGESKISAETLSASGEIHPQAGEVHSSYPKEDLGLNLKNDEERLPPGPESTKGGEAPEIGSGSVPESLLTPSGEISKTVKKPISEPGEATPATKVKEPRAEQSSTEFNERGPSFDAPTTEKTEAPQLPVLETQPVEAAPNINEGIPVSDTIKGISEGRITEIVSSTASAHVSVGEPTISEIEKPAVKTSSSQREAPSGVDGPAIVESKEAIKAHPGLIEAQPEIREPAEEILPARIESENKSVDLVLEMSKARALAPPSIEESAGNEQLKIEGPIIQIPIEESIKASGDEFNNIPDPFQTRSSDTKAVEAALPEDEIQPTAVEDPEDIKAREKIARLNSELMKAATKEKVANQDAVAELLPELATIKKSLV